MKKLMILAAAVMLAAVTHAAAVGWSIAGASAYAGGSYSVSVIGPNGVTDANQMVALVAAGTAVDSYAFGDGTVAANGAASSLATVSGKSITYSGSGTDTYEAFAILWTSDNSAASYTATKSITMDNDSTSKNWLFGNQSTSLASNQFAVVPEPTSGLLLLLGMAGLALKRKVA